MLTNEDTVKFFTIPYVDENGDFYCRIVHSILHEQKNQHVCGIGCPYYDGRYDIYEYSDEVEKFVDISDDFYRDLIKE